MGALIRFIMSILNRNTKSVLILTFTIFTISTVSGDAESSRKELEKMLGIDLSNVTIISNANINEGLTIIQDSCTHHHHKEYHHALENHCEGGLQAMCVDSYKDCMMNDYIRNYLRPRWNKWAVNICLAGFQDNDKCLSKDSDKS